MLAAKTAAATNDEQRWAAMMEAMTELMKATSQMREENAAFQAKTDAHAQETSRRLDVVEERIEKQADKTEQQAAHALNRQIDIDWKIMAIAASLLGNAMQIFGSHITLHW